MEGYAIENCFEISGKEFAEEGHFIEMRRHLSAGRVRIGTGPQTNNPKDLSYTAKVERLCLWETTYTASSLNIL